ncbi:MAG: hypothetical protein HPY66_3054 [Firmicutes bacterium]|nr:hypothetical protein [Bacillota bacterium]
MSIKQNDTGLTQMAENVLANYNIAPDQIRLIQNKGLKTLWEVAFKGRRMCLKRLRHSVDKAMFSVYAQVYIYNNGGNVPAVHLNRENNAITQYMDHLFVLYEWIEGRDLNFSDAFDLRLAMEGLARFHKASVGYRPPAEARTSSKLGKWPGQYRSMRDNMAKWKNLSMSKAGQQGYRSYLKHVDSVIEMADIAIKALDASPYSAAASVDNEQCPLCHQDYGEGNALLSEKGVFVLDLDGVTYDLPARDLRKLIGKQMEDNGWTDKSIASQILGSYEKNNGLSKQEKEILKIDLLFPHWFFAEVKNLFKKNKPVEDSKIERAARMEQAKFTMLQHNIGDIIVISG